MYKHKYLSGIADVMKLYFLLPVCYGREVVGYATYVLFDVRPVSNGLILDRTFSPDQIKSDIKRRLSIILPFSKFKLFANYLDIFIPVVSKLQQYLLLLLKPLTPVLFRSIACSR